MGKNCNLCNKPLVAENYAMVFIPPSKKVYLCQICYPKLQEEMKKKGEE